jgi:hypothetical protein
MEVIQQKPAASKNGEGSATSASKLNRSLNSSLRLRTTSGQETSSGKSNNALIRKYSDKINRNLIHIEPVPFLSKASNHQEHKRSCPLPVTSSITAITTTTTTTTAPNDILIIKNDLTSNEECGSDDGIVDTGLIETEIEKLASESIRRLQFKRSKLKKTNSSQAKARESKKLILAAANAVADRSDGFPTSTSFSGHSSTVQITPPPVSTQNHSSMIIVRNIIFEKLNCQIIYASFGGNFGGYFYLY